MKRFFLFTTFIALLLTNGQAQKNVTALPLDSGVTVKGETFCYMLSTTAFKVTVDVTKTSEIKGYYADQAQALLGLNNVISENKTSYHVSNVNIEPVQVPDEKHAYLVQLSQKQRKANRLTGFSKKKSFASSFSKNVQQYTTYSEQVPNFFKNYSNPSFMEKEDSFVETKIIDGVVTQVPANRTTVVSKSSSQKAQEAADAISKSHKDQYALIAGEQETPYTAETMDAMLQELKQWEENYLSLFIGIVLEDHLEYTFFVIPAAGASSLPIFACSPTEGFTTQNIANNSNTYSLSFQPVYQTAELEQAIKDSQSDKPAKKNGYRFRKAMPVKVALQKQHKNIHEFGIFNMDQFGRIQTLPVRQDKTDIQHFGFVF